MNKCYVCGKGAQHILRVSHSKQRTHHWSKPNLHSVKVEINGEVKTIKLCTKCLRKYKAGLLKIS